MRHEAAAAAADSMWPSVWRCGWHLGRVLLAVALWWLTLACLGTWLGGVPATTTAPIPTPLDATLLMMDSSPPSTTRASPHGEAAAHPAVPPATAASPPAATTASRPTAPSHAALPARTLTPHARATAKPPLASTSTSTASTLDPAAQSAAATPATSNIAGPDNPSRLPSASTATPASIAPGEPTASGDHGAQLIAQPLPQIPDELRGEATEATAYARFTIHPDGSVEVALLQALRNPRLNRLLLEALRQWRFRPALRDGKPVSSEQDLRVRLAIQ